jgi:hypothetical protein
MNASHHFIYCSNGSDFVMSRQLWAGAVPSVQAGGRVNTQPNPLSPRCSKVPRVPETKGRLSSVRCDETQRDCRAVLPPRPRRTALSKQCCILHSAGSQAIEKTTSRSSEVQNKRCVCCTPDRSDDRFDYASQEDGTPHLQRDNGDGAVKRGVVLPAASQRLSTVGDQRHASFFLFFSFLSSQG